MTRLPQLRAALLLYERGAVTVDVDMMRAVESIISTRAGSRRSGARGNLDMASEKNIQIQYRISSNSLWRWLLLPGLPAFRPKNDYMNSRRNVSAAKVAPR